MASRFYRAQLFFSGVGAARLSCGAGVVGCSPFLRYCAHLCIFKMYGFYHTRTEIYFSTSKIGKKIRCRRELDGKYLFGCILLFFSERKLSINAMPLSVSLQEFISIKSLHSLSGKNSFNYAKDIFNPELKLGLDYVYLYSGVLYGICKPGFKPQL